MSDDFPENWYKFRVSLIGLTKQQAKRILLDLLDELNQFDTLRKAKVKWDDSKECSILDLEINWMYKNSAKERIQTEIIKALSGVVTDDVEKKSILKFSLFNLFCKRSKWALGA